MTMNKMNKKSFTRSKEYLRGVRDAAVIADDYNSSTIHRYRLGDCILAKLNVIKGEPRKNKNPTRTYQAGEVCGMALALAEINRKHDQPSIVREVAREAGLTIAEMREAGVDSYDLKELRKVGVR